MDNLAVYIHWPFCRKKCPYCDFNSHVRDQIPESDYLDAYIKELEFNRELTGDRHINSIFFGGGTPSLMSVATVSKIIDTVSKLWTIDQHCEITLEANPTSTEAQKFKGYREAGVNRLSIGVQSLNDNDLKILGREHDVKEALSAIEIANTYFDRTSFDMIYTRPNQTEKDWEKELLQALPLTRGHVSLYQLTIERNTQFHTLYQSGRLPLPDEETSQRLYTLTSEICAAHGLHDYEVSNYASIGQESRHNLTYWTGGDYIGVGAGAHGRITSSDTSRTATRTHSAPEIWLSNVKNSGHGYHPFETLTQTQIFEEMVMTGLRLKQGLDLDVLEKKSGMILSPNKIDALKTQGYLEIHDNKVKLTWSGRVVLNSVLGYLLG